MYYSSRNHSHISNTPVLITQIVTMILVAALIFQVSNIAKTITTNETAATKTVTTANSSTIAITPDGYTYTVYGQLHQLTNLKGSSYGLVAFEPFTRSEDELECYGEYGWRSCYVPLDILEKISEPVDPENPDLGFKDPSEEKFFKIEMANDTNGGGFINLPNIILKVEEITAHDIPAWSGL